MTSPTPDQIRAARVVAGLSQPEAGALILSSKRSWENWEHGRAKMHPGLFDYFLIRTGQDNRTTAGLSDVRDPKYGSVNTKIRRHTSSSINFQELTDIPILYEDQDK